MIAKVLSELKKYSTILRVYIQIFPLVGGTKSKTSFPLQEGIFVYSRVFVRTIKLLYHDQ